MERNNKEIKKVETTSPTTEEKKPYSKDFFKVRSLRSVNYKQSESLDISRKKPTKIPPLKKGEIRLLIFGGVESIGMNCSAIEYEDQIVVVDCGFMFKNPELPGVDLQLPNVQYLEENKDKVKALFITHGHLDHIGAIPFLIEKMGNPKIYSRLLTSTLIRKRQSENHADKPLQYHDVEKNSKIKLSDNLSVSLFAVTHTIPDSMGVIFETPVGDIVFTGDLKLNHRGGVVDKEEEEAFDVFKNRKILCTLADSTNAEQPGFSVSEYDVIDNVVKILKNAKGRTIIGSFASQIERNIKFIEEAIKLGKKIAIEGRSMKTNLGIAAEVGLFKPDPKSLISVEEIDNYPEKDLLIFATGSLGEEYSALKRMSQNEHRQIKLNKRDTIILSSSVVPGNEHAVQILKDNLSRSGATIITYATDDVHSSGHANRGELKWIHSKINSKFLVPVHGFHYMLVSHGKIFQELGKSEKSVVYPENGSVIDIVNKGEEIKLRKEIMPKGITIVDGAAISDVQSLVIRDRNILAKDGMFITIVLINQKTRRLKKSPDIISRGFIYLRESQELLQKVRLLVKKNTENSIKGSQMINIENLKKSLTKDISNLLFYETNKKPIVIPVVFIY